MMRAMKPISLLTMTVVLATAVTLGTTARAFDKELAPTGLTLVVCDADNKVLDTVVIPEKVTITYRITVPEGRVAVRAFLIGEERILDWLRDNLTENYVEARTDKKGSIDIGWMEAIVKDGVSTGYEYIAGFGPLELTEKMRRQIKQDIAADQRSPHVTVKEPKD